MLFSKCNLLQKLVTYGNLDSVTFDTSIVVTHVSWQLELNESEITRQVQRPSADFSDKLEVSLVY